MKHFNSHNQPLSFKQNFNGCNQIFNTSFITFKQPKLFNQHGFSQNLHVQQNAGGCGNNYSNSFPKPTPTKIDNSTQFRRNNPAQNFKRPFASQISHPPNKIRSNFHSNKEYPYRVYDMHEFDSYNDPTCKYLHNVPCKNDTIPDITSSIENTISEENDNQFFRFFSSIHKICCKKKRQS